METNAQWRQVVGWPDYEVSNTGIVRKVSTGAILSEWNGQVRLALSRTHRTWRKVEGLVIDAFGRPYVRPSVENLTPGETWKAVAGHSGYLVSSLRRVWSWKTMTFVGHRVDKNGTRNVLFSDHTSMTVDKIYAEAFGHNPPREAGEEWRESVSPGIWVSNLGRLYSTWNLSLLVPQKRPNGYLFIEGRDRRWPVHRLVAFAFVSGRDIFRDCIDHINEIKTDNRASNLRWCTKEENTAFYIANHSATGREGEKVRPSSL